MASEKENMQALKTIGAAFFAVGLVCAEILVSGCGAAPEDEQEIGQGSEALTVNGATGVFLYGSEAGSHAHCTLHQVGAAQCRWLHPYVWPFAGEVSPSRYSLTVSTANDGAQMSSIFASTILPSLNAQLANPFQGAIVDLNGPTAGPHSFNINSGVFAGNTGANDTIVAHYVNFFFSTCQGTPRVESPEEPGAFRSCTEIDASINYSALKANFPAARFVGNLKQVGAWALMVALGEGTQTGTAPAYTNLNLSTTVQSITAFATPSEALQLRSVNQSCDALHPQQCSAETTIAFFP